MLKNYIKSHLKGFGDDKSTVIDNGQEQATKKIKIMMETIPREFITNNEEKTFKYLLSTIKESLQFKADPESDSSKNVDVNRDGYDWQRGGSY